MKIAIGSDNQCHLTAEITAYMKEKGIELIPCGALAGNESDCWPNKGAWHNSYSF